MVWSVAMLTLGVAATVNWRAALFFGGLSAFGFAAVGALRRSYPRLALAFALVAWLPLPADTWRRASIAIDFSGLERPDVRHSPEAFMAGFIFDQLFFLPLTVMILLTAWRLWRSRRAIP
jgi:hypothetical protein